MIWRVSFDARSPTWIAYGRIVFVEAETAALAWEAAVRVAQPEYPDSELRAYGITPSTEVARAAFQVRQERYQQWLKNTRTGRPNGRHVL